ncbi:hypothetical protein [Aeromicrobium sp. UC242_57]|uniref:hypothetical protein n=1 Tax=Aeromicrobium sp. UC242_57 TaxID=3374624 RepID=UPI0037B2B9F9
MNPHDQVGALSPAGRPMRLVRSLAAALACVAAAAFGHHTAGGELSGIAVLAVFLGGASIAWSLSSRRVTGGQIVGLLLLCQVAVHLGASDVAMTMDASMLLGHAAATAFSALALARGEQFAWHLAERLGLRAAPIFDVTSPVPSLRPLAPVVVPLLRHDVLLAHSRWLRGPPMGS